MTGSRPTVYDVAERAGVSIATVSFTFRQPAKVKESTRRVVEAAARELGYIPSASARGLAGGRTGALGLLSLAFRPADGNLEAVAEAADDPNADWRLFPLYVDEVERGVEEACWRRGYAVMVAGATNSNSDTVLTDLAGRVDGLAVLSGMVADPELRRIAERLPVVLVSESRFDGEIPQINVDNAGGMRALVQHLVRVHGLRRMTYVGGLHDNDRVERFAAFRSTLRAAKRPVPDKPLAVDRDYRQTIGDVLERDLLPEAFVCGDDQVALAVMDALREHDVDVPGQVAVTGFDGIVAGRLASPQLTTVRQPMTAMGAEVVRLLVDRIEQPHAPAQSRRFPVTLVVRQSCGCAPS